MVSCLMGDSTALASAIVRCCPSESYPETSAPSRSPHGERGLKSVMNALYAILPRSLPARGAWVEIAAVRAVRL